MKTPRIIRPAPVEVSLPEDVRAKLDLHLYSEVENRIPFGAYKAFFVERIREFFAEKRTYLTEAECAAVRALWEADEGRRDISTEEHVLLSALMEKLK